MTHDPISAHRLFEKALAPDPAHARHLFEKTLPTALSNVGVDVTHPRPSADWSVPVLHVGSNLFIVDEENGRMSLIARDETGSDTCWIESSPVTIITVDIDERGVEILTNVVYALANYGRDAKIQRLTNERDRLVDALHEQAGEGGIDVDALLRDTRRTVDGVNDSAG